MGILSRFEDKMEDRLEGAADRFSDAPISPVQIAKKAEKQMRRQKMVGAGKQYAPTLYTVLVNPDDDDRLFGYYPTLAGETETYLRAKAADEGLSMDGPPLVRFIVDENLKRGRFDVIAELVAAPIVRQLRQEELERYGSYSNNNANRGYQPYAEPYDQQYDQPYDDPYDAPYDDSYGQPYDEHYDTYDPYQGFDDYNYPDTNMNAGYNNGVAQTMLLNGVAQAAGNTRADQAPHAQLVNRTDHSVHDLWNAVSTIGRSNSCDIIVPDVNASRAHAELRCNAFGNWTITDLNSTNGLMVNGRRITKENLSDGDRITIGTTSFEFVDR